MDLSDLDPTVLARVRAALRNAGFEFAEGGSDHELWSLPVGAHYLDLRLSVTD